MAMAVAVDQMEGERIRAGRLVRAGGRSVHVLDVGSGPPIVLLHGLGGLAQEILEPFEHLSARFRLIAPDRAGYGYSDPLPAARMTPAGQARWLAALLDRLGVRRCLLVAHSIGAATALALALAAPQRVAGLVLVAPFCRPTRPAAMPWLRLAVAPVVGPPLRNHVVPLLAPRLAPSRLAALFAPEPVPPGFADFPILHAARGPALQAMAAELRGYNRTMIPAALKLRRCRVPTLVIAGTADPVAACDRHAGWLAHRNPAARLARLPGAGHMPHHTQAGTVFRIVRDHAFSCLTL